MTSKLTRFLLVMSLASVSMAAALRPGGLRCEYRTNPLGVDVANPRLSWVLAPLDLKARGLKQSAWRVLVASSEDSLRAGKGDLWDSGKVETDQSIHVAYAGKPLESGTRAFWKVQVWDQAGAAAAWSDAAHWSMGLLKPGDWKGQWIGLDDAATSDAEYRPLPARMLRKEFDVARGLKRATVYVSGLGLSELYLNGAKAGDYVLSPRAGMQSGYGSATGAITRPARRNPWRCAPTGIRRRCCNSTSNTPTGRSRAL